MAYLSEQSGSGGPSAPEGPAGAPQVPAPEPPQVPEPKGDGLGSLRSIQALVTVSIIAGPVSMIVGGVLLSAVALGCALVALAKVRRVEVPEGTDGALVQAVRHQAMVGVGIGVVALVLNAVTLALLMPGIIEAAQTGDFSSLLGGAGMEGGSGGSAASEGSSSSDSSSVWG